MDNVRKNLWRYLGTLVMDRDSEEGEPKVSLGRLGTTLLLIMSMLIWAGVISGKEGATELPESMSHILTVLLGFVLGSKGVSVGKEAVKRYKGRKDKKAEYEEPGHMPE